MIEYFQRFLHQYFYKYQKIVLPTRSYFRFTQNKKNRIYQTPYKF